MAISHKLNGERNLFVVLSKKRGLVVQAGIHEDWRNCQFRPTLKLTNDGNAGSIQISPAHRRLVDAFYEADQAVYLHTRDPTGKAKCQSPSSSNALTFAVVQAFDQPNLVAASSLVDRGHWHPSGSHQHQPAMR